MEKMRLSDHIKTTRSRATPLTPGVKLTDTEAQGKLIDTASHPYRSVVGSISHLTNFCFPILAFARSQLSSHLADPREGHWKELKNVAIFVGQHKELGILARFGVHPKYPGVLTRSDSSYRDHMPTPRSTLSHHNYFNGSIVEWNSKGEKTLATSTAVAETVARAADRGVRGGLQIRYLLEEVLPKEWLDIMGAHKHELDNKSAWNHITH
jgi:hypothetical protein